jgi:hypothetical protein
MAEPVRESSVAPTTPVRSVTTTAPRAGAGSLIIRILLTLAGAAGMIVGPFLDWIPGRVGTDVSIRSLWTSAFASNPNFVATIGFLMIVLGLLAVVGLVPRSGWLTRLAGALGLVELILFGIQVYRAPSLDLQNLQAGVWVALAGSIVALIGGFFGTRTRVVVSEPVTE